VLKHIHLTRFKNFDEATLSLGPFTLLVGTNASGKSNVREALRFLHGIGRGYTLAEIFGGKWSAGARQWEGLRGGEAEASFRRTEEFAIALHIEGPHLGKSWPEPRFAIKYRIRVETRPSFPVRVIEESLYDVLPEDDVTMLYDSHPRNDAPQQKHRDQIVVKLLGSEHPSRTWEDHTLSADRPVLAQILDRDDDRPSCVEAAINETLDGLGAMRFIDLSPDAMRQPSTPGQRVLSDRGENLSSVLQALCSDESTKAELLHWIRALTPMDVVDLRFPADLRGQVLLVLVEKDGTAPSAYSASEGTLRFLGMLATLLSPEPGFFFFEEIENGLHPSRLRLLVDLIRERTHGGQVQVVATTHSPTLLALLDDDMLRYASLVYRLEGEPSARITRLFDVPDAERVMVSHDRAELLASGWFEDMVEFGAAPREPLKKASVGEPSA
jgi:AAA domain, putative AbiEii toxin, Type IV TA system